MYEEKDKNVKKAFYDILTFLEIGVKLTLYPDPDSEYLKWMYGSIRIRIRNPYRASFL